MWDYGHCAFGPIGCCMSGGLREQSGQTLSDTALRAGFTVSCLRNGSTAAGFMGFNSPGKLLEKGHNWGRVFGVAMVSF